MKGRKAKQDKTVRGKAALAKKIQALERQVSGKREAAEFKKATLLNTKEKKLSNYVVERVEKQIVEPNIPERPPIKENKPIQNNFANRHEEQFYEVPSQDYLPNNQVHEFDEYDMYNQHYMNPMPQMDPYNQYNHFDAGYVDYGMYDPYMQMANMPRQVEDPDSVMNSLKKTTGEIVKTAVPFYLARTLDIGMTLGLMKMQSYLPEKGLWETAKEAGVAAITNLAGS